MEIIALLFGEVFVVASFLCGCYFILYNIKLIKMNIKKDKKIYIYSFLALLMPILCVIIYLISNANKFISFGGICFYIGYSILPSAFCTHKSIRKLIANGDFSSNINVNKVSSNTNIKKNMIPKKISKNQQKINSIKDAKFLFIFQLCITMFFFIISLILYLKEHNAPCDDGNICATFQFL